MIRRAAMIAFALVLAACSPADDAATITTEPAGTVPEASTTTTAAETAPYRDPAVPIDRRIDDLLGRMTLDEKIGQMTLVAEAFIGPAQVAEQGFGAVLSGGGGAPEPNTPQAWIEMIGAFQDAALSTRLGIPILYGSDAIHGHNNLKDAVIFPHNVGLGAARSADLVERIGAATAVEAAATGVTWNYAPVLAVPQDIRWGRTYEGFGETTELVTELGIALQRGLQGVDLTDARTVLATPKHFVADGATDWGSSTTESYWIDQGDVTIDEAVLRDVHLAPYVDAIDAGALSVMASYSSFQGTKMHASGRYLMEVLKGELGFEGFVVSDWAAIDQIDPDDYYTSVVTAINAGIDMNMVPGDYVAFSTALRDAAGNGDVPVERIDDAVRRILRAKFALGLFERPHPEPGLVAEIGSAAHRSLASEAVERSLVLLTNDGEALPVSGETVFVAGFAADDVGWQSGGWTISWQGATGPTTRGTTILDGIVEMAASDTRVVYDPLGRFDGEDVPDRAATGIVVIGERPYAEGVGDDSRLEIDPGQMALIGALRDRVDSLVVVVLSGRPVILGDAFHVADAVVAAWLPGSEGAAVARPLFAAVPFQGRSPYTWPRSVDQLPVDPTADGGSGCDAPLFPYGHGLAIDDVYEPDELDCEAGS